MLNFIRKFKASYILYNFFQKKKLEYNVAKYQKLKLRKKYYSPISSKDFVGIDSSILSTSINTYNKPSDTVLYNQLNVQSQVSIDAFNENGYAIIPSFLTNNEVEIINSEIKKLLLEKKIKNVNGGKLMFAIHHSSIINAIANNENLLSLLTTMLKWKPTLFQSINFIMGSEQHTHSDSIHMTTFPLGGLVGLWFALEDINENNGPLHYYPGSHKLPYYLNNDYDNEGNNLFIGNKTYDKYEKMIEEKIKEKGLQKKIFLAKKGDLLIWHANLFHGGENHIDKNLTRKSMVLHYYNKEAICYHEINQRPALIKPLPNFF